MKKRVWALLLALAVVVSLPCRANAETPAQFYNNLASVLGVSLDVAGSAWQDKTKAAYLAYIEDEMTHNLTSPNAIYDSAFQLEGLTGYDIVYAEGGVLYMNTVTDQAGGAFGGVQISWSNYSTLLDNYVRWIRLAVNEGPAWPHGGSSSTEQQQGPYNWPINVTGWFGTWPDRTGYNAPGLTKGLTYYEQSIGNTVNSRATNRYSVLVPVRVFQYADETKLNSTSYLYQLTSTSPITMGYTQTGTRDNTKTYEITYSSDTAVSLYTYTLNNAREDPLRIYRSDNTNGLTSNGRVWGAFTSVTTSYEPPATDNTPPSGGDVLPITITWPDITYTGPTYNYEGDTYSTTSGEIDWTPVTDRLDEMAEQFELFAGSFESLRSDFLQMWHALGGGLQGISGQLTTLEGKLNRVIDWLINIFNKIPSGAQATQPNPDTDEGGFWDWMGRLLDKLVGNLPEGVADFTSALSQLTGRFPFSVPWDLAALLGLFAHEPITPRATFYLPTVTEQGFAYDAQNAVPLVVDLTSFNDVASLCRGLQYIVFAIALAKWSIEGMRGIDWTLFG